MDFYNDMNPTPYDKMQDERNMRIACAHLTKDLLVAGAVGGEKPTPDDLVAGAKRLYSWVTGHDSKYVGADPEEPAAKMSPS